MFQVLFWSVAVDGSCQHYLKGRQSIDQEHVERAGLARHAVEQRQEGHRFQRSSTEVSACPPPALPCNDKDKDALGGGEHDAWRSPVIIFVHGNVLCDGRDGWRKKKAEGRPFS